MPGYAVFPQQAKVAFETSWSVYTLLDEAWQIREEPRSAKHNCDDTNGKRLRLSNLKSCLFPVSTAVQIIPIPQDWATDGIK
jgi:hypothetical protein